MQLACMDVVLCFAMLERNAFLSIYALLWLTSNRRDFRRKGACFAFAFADTLQRVSASALPHNMFGLERETPSSGIYHSPAPLSICFVGLAQKEPAIPSCACGSPFHVTWRAVFR